MLERAAILSHGESLNPSDLRFSAPIEAAETSDEAELTLEQVERRHIEKVLGSERGHVERAAARLGVPRSSLYERLKRLGIVVRRE